MPVSVFFKGLKFRLCVSRFSPVDPNFYSKNLLMLGKTYMAMKDKEKALLWLTKAKEYPAHTQEDKEVRDTRTISFRSNVFSLVLNPAVT